LKISKRYSIVFAFTLSVLVLFPAFQLSLVWGFSGNESYELLIIGVEAYRNRIQEFIDFKRSQGIIARYASVEYIGANFQGSDMVERIHVFVSGEHEHSGIRYLLLVGTYEQVPTKYVYSPSPESGFADFNYKPTDWYYAVPFWQDSRTGVLMGNVPEIAVGRLPVRNEVELDRLLSKIVNVERQPRQGLFLVFSSLNVKAEPVLNVCHTYYNVEGNLKPLSQILNSEVAYALTFTHGSSSSIWMKNLGGEWKTLMTTEDVDEIAAAYNIHCLAACFAGALDLEGESLGRALAVSSNGPALVLASSRMMEYDDAVFYFFWKYFFDSGDVGGSIVEAIRSYLSDSKVFSLQKPSFQKYNLYLTKVLYGDVSWRVENPKASVEDYSDFNFQLKDTVLNFDAAQVADENGAQPIDLPVMFTIAVVFLCSVIKRKVYKPGSC